MDKHIVKFNNHTQYEAFIASTDYIEPHVSICKTEGDVHYNKVRSTTLVHCDDGSDSAHIAIYNSEGNKLIELTGTDGYITIPENQELYVHYYNNCGIYSFDGQRITDEYIENWKDVGEAYKYANVPLDTNEITYGLVD